MISFNIYLILKTNLTYKYKIQLRVLNLIFTYFHLSLFSLSFFFSPCPQCVIRKMIRSMREPIHICRRYMWPYWTMCVHINESGNRRANKQTNKPHWATRGLFCEFCKSHIHFWDWLLPTSFVSFSLFPLSFPPFGQFSGSAHQPS